MLVASIILIALGSWVAWDLSSSSPDPVAMAMTWRGITPGRTNALDAIQILGDDPHAEHRDQFWAYRYEQPLHLGWEIVELWATDDEDGERRVFAIYAEGPISSGAEGQGILEERRTASLVSRLGPPSDVQWGTLRWRRALIWAEHGVMASATAHFTEPTFKVDDSRLTVLVLFEPIRQRAFLRHSLDWPWPWGPKWSSSNMYDDHSPDTLPRDPFDWRESLDSSS